MWCITKIRNALQDPSSLLRNIFFFFCNRFSIDRTTDQEMIFYIDPESGAITLGKILDREIAGWHNITVKAEEAGTLSVLKQY